MRDIIAILIVISILFIIRLCERENCIMADEWTGVSSYYTDESVDPRWGGVTKSGEKFDETKPTCAVLPSQWKKLKGRKLRVTSVDTGKSVVVKVNDTGGFEKYGRSIDLSKSAFETIAPLNKGLTNVKIEVVEDGDE